MTDKLFYICDKCSSLFEDKELARQCEESHKPPSALPVVRTSYEHKSIYPSYVWLQMADGQICRYQRLTARGERE